MTDLLGTTVPDPVNSVGEVISSHQTNEICCIAPLVRNDIYGAGCWCALSLSPAMYRWRPSTAGWWNFKLKESLALDSEHRGSCLLVCNTSPKRLSYEQNINFYYDNTLKFGNTGPSVTKINTE